LEAARWWRVDDWLGRKAGAGLRVAASVMGADGEEQGIGAWRRTGRDLGARARQRWEGRWWVDLVVS
jgi:hypothetical protein